MKALDFNGESFLVAFRKARKKHMKYISQAAHEYALTPNQAEIMLFLWNNAEFNTAKDIVHYISVSKGLVSRSIDALIQRGYLLTAEDEKDGRLQRLIITSEGKIPTEKLSASSNAFFRQMTDGIPKKELQICYHTILTILENIHTVSPEE